MHLINIRIGKQFLAEVIHSEGGTCVVEDSSGKIHYCWSGAPIGATVVCIKLKWPGKAQLHKVLS